MEPCNYSSDRLPDRAQLLALYEDANWTNYSRDPVLLEKAVKASLYVVCAWQGDELIGLARVVGDDHSIAYLQDILVRRSHQRQGIGKQLHELVEKRFAHVRQLVLLTDSKPETIDFYQSMGMQACDGKQLIAFARFK